MNLNAGSDDHVVVNYGVRGKSALITGGARGIGAAIAQEFLRNGATVVVADVDSAAVDTAVQEMAAAAPGRVHGVVMNVTSRDSVAAAAAHVDSVVGPIDFLINNAGIGDPAETGTAAGYADWDRTLAVNLDGTYNVTSEFLSRLTQTKGSVVNLCSVVAFTSGFAGAGYCASKGAVRSLTQKWAREFAPHDIRVNAVAPGYVATPMSGVGTEEIDRWVEWHTPMGRFADPREIAGPIVFLCSEAASYINGVTLPVDGGYLVI